MARHGTTIMGFNTGSGYILAHDGFCSHRKGRKRSLVITERNANKYFNLSPSPNSINGVISGNSILMASVCKEVLERNEEKLKNRKGRGRKGRGRVTTTVYETVELFAEILHENTKEQKRGTFNSIIIGGFDGTNAVLYNISTFPSFNPKRSKPPVIKCVDPYWVVGGGESTRKMIRDFNVGKKTPVETVAEVIKKAMYEASEEEPETGGLIKAILHTSAGEDHLLYTVDKQRRRTDGIYIYDIKRELDKKIKRDEGNEKKKGNEKKRKADQKKKK